MLDVRRIGICEEDHGGSCIIVVIRACFWPRISDGSLTHPAVHSTRLVAAMTRSAPVRNRHGWC